MPAACDSVPSAWTQVVEVACFKSSKELKALISRNRRSPEALLLPELPTFSRCPARQRPGSSDGAPERTWNASASGVSSHSTGPSVEGFGSPAASV